MTEAMPPRILQLYKTFPYHKINLIKSTKTILDPPLVNG